MKNNYLITKRRSLKKFKVHLDSKTHLYRENVCFLEWIESGRPLIQLSTEKHTKPNLCNCNFTPQRQYFETFVHRNPLIRDEILFIALFRDADQVYFLRNKHANSATIFLIWHAGLFTRSDLDRNSCAYNLRTFEVTHFGITWIITRLYSFNFFINYQPHWEINSQMIATCLAHTLIFKVTTIITFLVVCCRVEARAVVGCWTTCSMYASGPSIATRSNHNSLLRYRLTCIYLSAVLYP